MHSIARVIAMTELPLTFPTQKAWEDWLVQHGNASAGVWLRLAKKGAKSSTLTYAQALESVLCHGWIDGQKQAESETYWLQRFTRRSAKSLWSKINKDKDGRWERAYTSASNSTVPEDFQRVLDANPKARTFFASLNSRNRYALLFRIQSARKPETLARKIDEFVEMLNRGETLY